MRERLLRYWQPYCRTRVDEDDMTTLVCLPRATWSAHTVQLQACFGSLSVEVWADDSSSLATILCALISMTGESVMVRESLSA